MDSCHNLKGVRMKQGMKDYEARIAAYLELATFADLDRDADNFRLSDDSHLLSPEDDLYHNEEKNERV